MDIAWIGQHLASLDGVREEVAGSRTTWRVQGRLVARLEDVRPVLTAAWELQRRE